ncbi:dihydrodipicolinate synthase family protein [Bosea caraganae]|uniref:Dihydrodipicolinate synthase family protein n=1 Tax=Bosea caraganae TaxID=2763117 RepID=A0A370LBK2_9HYPH|nr:dihydrodipicolinate synthase family protein [Bosea caraganae]RDJ27336.1 dihydrodipicolinate synthase family protein [Bosea caraganae]RDJ29352.1 dihydrodipicolinate synthase family protein [Bosea caraganae]
MTKWSGVLPAVTTKFTEDDKLDIAEMERCFKLQLDAGVHGLIVCGSLGEASTLEPDEKIEILKTAIRVADGKVPVLLTVAQGSTKAASKLAEAGAKAGAEGFMVLPGVPYKSDQRETALHYRTVARAGGLPVMIYNNPVGYGVDIPPTMLAELGDEPLFTAIKESSDDVRRISEIKSLCGDRFAVLTGVDNLALESLALGADGWVAGLVVAYPRETVVIYELAKAGRMEEAIAIYRWFRPLLDLDVSNRLVQNIKLVEALVIGSNDRCRAPRLPLAGAERARVEAIVKAAEAKRPALPKL